MDIMTKEERSKRMSLIRSRDTKPEITFRKMIWGMGVRDYRVKNKILGKPDLYFPKKWLAVFIDGCFWHKCPKCYVAPKSNTKYWREKMEANKKRDSRINRKLKSQGIKVVRIWEHDVRNNPQKSAGLLTRKLL